jgi:hypothetical protein
MKPFLSALAAVARHATLFNVAAVYDRRTSSPTPTGLESYSPGLAQQRLPWVNPEMSNPERVEANLFHTLGDPASTLTGLKTFACLPRVAVVPQPWAICLQPFQGCDSSLEAVCDRRIS